MISTLSRFKLLHSLWDFGKCLSRVVKKLLSMMVETMPLYGGLNHFIFLFLFLFLLIFLLKSGLNLILSLKPLLEIALLKRSLELSNTYLSDNNLLIRREILSGKFFRKLGGWFDFTLIYSGILPDLLYSRNLRVCWSFYFTYIKYQVWKKS